MSRAAVVLIRVLVMTAVGMGQPGGSGAAVYKWVDDQGKTHYGERPPPGQSARTVDVNVREAAPGAPAAAAPDWKRQELEFQERRARAAADEQRQAELARQRTQACASANAWLERNERVRTYYRSNEKGERVAMDDAARDRLVASKRAERDALCGR